MNALNIELFKSHVRKGAGWSPPRSLFISRHFDGAWEALFEVHRSSKHDFACAEEFLALSIENEFGVKAPDGAKKKYDSYEIYSKIVNRVAAKADIESMFGIFQPPAPALPSPQVIRKGLVLFDHDDEKWWFLEGADDQLFSVRWSMSG